MQAPPEAENGSNVGTELVISEQLEQTVVAVAAATTLPTIGAETVECSPTNGGSTVEEKVSASKRVLPDLNLPLEETPYPDIQCGVS